MVYTILASPLSKHVLYTLPIASSNLLLQLLLSEPLEVLVAELILLEIDLACHYPRLQEESLRAVLRNAGWKLDGVFVVVLVVSDGNVADEPGVDIGAAGLAKNAVCCLWVLSVVEKLNVKRRTYAVEILVVQAVLRELPQPIFVLDKQIQRPL
jgi:hypothetical protein